MGLRVKLGIKQENGSMIKDYYPQFIELDSCYINTYNNLVENYYFHNSKQTIDIDLPTHHIETDSNNITDDNENNLIQNLGEDIEGKHYYLNAGEEFKGESDSHSIRLSTTLLYFYSYLLELKANENLLESTINNLKANPQSAEYENCIGKKAKKNKGKYQLSTALINDFMQATYNSLQEVKKKVLGEVKQQYKQNKKLKNESSLKESPEKIYPLVYLLSEIGHIAKLKSKDIEEFDILRMVDLIAQLQEIKIYTRILDEEFFKELENKQCSVEDIRSILKCQPFIVVDENNKALLKAENMEEIFLHKDFTRIASQILEAYKTA
ncbi:hypothetical protein CQA53_10105 [Helicobacter didelphidarum]|uniref:Uncharacterized protein n=1 Tax=Helicobacter didelphidarum TaxID=2040648 RepID=A0A3D8I8H8_9HELI|nr:hypothetical protein CQA53_10105 [Helicobacter didelphidarum]